MARQSSSLLLSLHIVAEPWYELNNGNSFLDAALTQLEKIRPTITQSASPLPHSIVWFDWKFRVMLLKYSELPN